MSSFGPDNTLRNQQINPLANDRLADSKSAVDSAVASLGSFSGTPGFEKIDPTDSALTGKAEGAVNVQSTAKRQKLAQRAVKKMFKKFPDKRTE